MPDIVFVDIGHGVELRGQETPAQRAVRDDGDAQFAAGGGDAVG